MKLHLHIKAPSWIWPSGCKLLTSYFRIWPIFLRLRLLGISAECQMCSVRSDHPAWARNPCYLGLQNPWWHHRALRPQLALSVRQIPQGISPCECTAIPLATEPGWIALWTAWEPQCASFSQYPNPQILDALAVQNFCFLPP